MKKYLIIILCTISGISFAQLPLKTLEKATSNNMFIGVDATDSLGKWMPFDSITGFSVLADSSKWTVSGTNLFPKSLTANVGIGLNNPSEQLEITENFELPMSTDLAGNIYKNTNLFIHNYGTDNTFIGINSGNLTSTGSGRNAAIGYNSLISLTSGYYNNASGYRSLYKLTTGNSNNAMGYNSLYYLTTGNSNSAVGRSALGTLTTGSFNVGIGNFAGSNINTGNYGVYIGNQSGYQSSNVDIGSYNVVIGASAGSTLGTGTANVLLGYDVELAAPNTSNQLNIGNAIYATGLGTGSTPSATAAVGIGTSTPAAQLELTESFRTPATTSSTTGVWYKGTTPFIHNFQHPTGGTATPVGYNTFIGGAGNFTMGSTATSISHSSYNVGIGSSAMYSNTTGSSNFALGQASMYSNTTGSGLVGIGQSSLYNNISGNQNVAIGREAMWGNKYNSRNVAVGWNAMFYAGNTSIGATYNIGIGSEAFYGSGTLANNTGTNNIGIGDKSIYSNSSGSYNVGIGNNVLYGNTTGTYNTSIGHNSGRYIADGITANTTSDYSIYLGANTKAGADNNQNEVVIGYNAIGSGSNTITLGGSTNTITTIPYGNVGIGTSTPAAQLHTTGTVRLAGAGTPGAGKVLTSDADGDATWETPAGGGDTQDLSIDSLGRRFQISLVDGGSVKFLDTNSGGTVTSIASGNGMNFSTITSTGTVTMGTPSSLSSITTNAVTTTSHTHAIDTSSTKGIATQHDLLSKLGTTLTSGNIFVGNASNIATGVTMSGDATMSNAGALSIGANKITEAMLKAVDSPADEEYLTYETTTGDFEWQAFSGLTGSGTSGQVPYFSGTSTLASHGNLTFSGATGLMHLNGKLAIKNTGTSGLRYTMYIPNATYGLTLYPSNSTPSAPITIMKADSSTRAFVFYPTYGSIGLGNTANQGEAGQALLSGGHQGQAYWGNPTATVDQKFAKFYRSSVYNVNHTSNKALPLFDDGGTNTAFNLEGFTLAAGDTTLQVPAAGYYELSLNMKAITTAETGSSSLQFQYFIGDSSPTGCYLGYQTLTSPNSAAEQITYNTIVYIPAPLSSNKLKIKVASTVSGAVYSQITAVDFTIKRIE